MSHSHKHLYFFQEKQRTNNSLISRIAVVVRKILRNVLFDSDLQNKIGMSLSGFNSQNDALLIDTLNSGEEQKQETAKHIIDKFPKSLKLCFMIQRYAWTTLTMYLGMKKTF